MRTFFRWIGRLLAVCSFFVITGAISVVWLRWGLGLEGYRELIGMPANSNDRGVWGDSFGALNTLFGALGFCVLSATLAFQLLQNYRLAADQHRQRFDSSYFELLKLLREARTEVRYKTDAGYHVIHGRGTNTEVEGLAVFRTAWKEAEYNITKSNVLLDKEQIGNLYYDVVHKRYESNLGPYYRLIYTILRRIDNDPVLRNSEKALYGNLLRTQLTSYELALIALNGLCSVSRDMSKYIVKYHLLKYMPEKSARRRLLVKYYPKSAFEGRD